jgi:hypothetical protein
MSKGILALFAIALFVIFSPQSAAAETFTAYLTSAQEVPANGSTARGFARVFVNEATGSLQFTVVFTGLSSAQTASHIHAPGAIGVNVGVAINFGVVGGTSGTISGSTTITPTQLSQLRAHLGYVNVHSTNFPGGEIRGQLGIGRPVDFDGDGRQDLSVVRSPGVAPPNVDPRTYYNLNTTSGVQIANWGDANRDIDVPGDYDGDTKTDFAVYRPGASTGQISSFYIYRSSDNTVQIVQWGVFGDRAVCRDYDGDGRTDIAVYHRGASFSTPAQWWIINSSNAAVRVITWGISGDATGGDSPAPGDYDGDGKFDAAVYRFGTASPANTFLVFRSSDSTAVLATWGNYATDFIVPGDFDGDGKYDYSVVRTGATQTAPMTWWIFQSSNNQARAVQWGVNTDQIVQGDYDGDARTDIAIYRPGASTGQTSFFWIINSLDLSIQTTAWGQRGDQAVANFDLH